MTGAGADDADGTLGRRCREARFEFRAWNVTSELVERLRSTAEFGEPDVARDRYVVGPIGSVNVKIRDGEVQVKRLLDVHDGFQRWCPTWEPRLPLAERNVVRLWGELGIPAPPTGATSTDELSTLAGDDPDLLVVDVTKQRRHATAHGVSTELGEVRSGGRTVTTVALESTDLAGLRDSCSRLGLDAYDNVAVHVAVGHRWTEVLGDGP